MPKESEIQLKLKEEMNLERPPAFIWQWEVDGDRQRAKLELILGGEVIKEYPWSPWAKSSKKVEYGYWKNA